jgi:hypothetical protein
MCNKPNLTKIFILFLSSAPPIKMFIPVENYTNGIVLIVVFCRLLQFHLKDYINPTIVLIIYFI